ncbi:MAG: VCBS repeat-containing protein [Phycisphaerales bacterium]
MTTCDIDGDGSLGVLVAPGVVTGSGPARCAVFLRQQDGSMRFVADHPLSKFADVRAALWGDVDNDGLVDVVLCSPAGTRLIMQGRGDDGRPVWRDATTTAGLQGMPSADGALADLDHDGDLDLLLVGGGHGGREASMLMNLDGRRFRDITAEAIPATIQSARQVVLGDFDGDRDVDIFIRCAAPPHALLRNDRLWAWKPWNGAEQIVDAPVMDAVAGDVDETGRIDLVLARDASIGSVRVATFPQRQEGGRIIVAPRPDLGSGDGSGWMALADLEGDGRLRLCSRAKGQTAGLPPGSRLVGWTFANFDVRRGSSMVVLAERGEQSQLLVETPPSPERFDFAGIVLRGRTDPGQSMRSNASGIGALVNARVADRWITRSSLSMSSTPGQSLQPIVVGLAGANQIDFVDIDWSDGVFQSELAVPAGGPTTIVETQRQISSCPLIFAWNGSRFEFVSDFLGVGGIGYLVKPGEYAPPRPWENFLLPEGALAPRRDDDGPRFVLKLNEPMEEAVYLDRVGLVAYDLPPGWSMTLDERMGLAGPEPSGETRWFRASMPPVRAFAAHGDGAPIDATSALRAADGDAVPVGELDTRFIGRLRDELVVTLEFAEPIDGHAGGVPRTPTLVASGWIEYPYCQTNFAAAQAGASYDAPTIEARAIDGTWSVVLANFGYPAGMPREMSVPLPALPRGCTALRIRTNQEIHWDSLAVAFVEATPAESAAHQLRLVSASLESNGYPRRTEGPHRRPIYHDDQRTPMADMRVQPGYYTRLGQVDVLVSRQDGASAIFGPGEEIVLRFEATLPALPDGWTRRYVLETRGWCKDMDLFTRDGDTLGPIPGERDPAAEAMHRRFNDRFDGGR